MVAFCSILIFPSLYDHFYVSYLGNGSKMLKYQGYLGLKMVQKLTEMSQKKESKATKKTLRIR